MPQQPQTLDRKTERRLLTDALQAADLLCRLTDILKAEAASSVALKLFHELALAAEARGHAEIEFRTVPIEELIEEPPEAKRRWWHRR
jgi:hypothetical protein